MSLCSSFIGFLAQNWKARPIHSEVQLYNVSRLRFNQKAKTFKKRTKQRLERRTVTKPKAKGEHRWTHCKQTYLQTLLWLTYFSALYRRNIWSHTPALHPIFHLQPIGENVFYRISHFSCYFLSLIKVELKILYEFSHFAHYFFVFDLSEETDRFCEAEVFIGEMRSLSCPPTG